MIVYIELCDWCGARISKTKIARHAYGTIGKLFCAKCEKPHWKKMTLDALNKQPAKAYKIAEIKAAGLNAVLDETAPMES